MTRWNYRNERMRAAACGLLSGRRRQAPPRVRDRPLVECWPLPNWRGRIRAPTDPSGSGRIPGWSVPVTSGLGDGGGTMARPVRTADDTKPLRPVKSHLIEEYNARTNVVRCDCGWSGNADDFAVHRRAVGAASPS